VADKPTTGHLDWITDDDSSKFIEPSGAKKLAGWLKEEKPPFQYFNWAFRVMDRWLQYFEAATDEESAARAAADAAEAAARIAGDFESGTCIAAFGQNSAPTGWTRKDDWQDNAMLCYAATGDIGSGGAANPQGAHSHGAGDIKTVVAKLNGTYDLSLFSITGVEAEVLSFAAAYESGANQAGYGSTALYQDTFYNDPDTNTGDTDENDAPFYQEVIAATKD